MQSQCDFLTENERTIVDLLKEQPRQHTEIMKTCLKKGISKRTVNNLLKKLEGKMIFRVEAENGIFYRLNIFPTNVLNLFIFIDNLVDYCKSGACERARKQRPTEHDWPYYLPHLLKMKNEVLMLYPKESFDSILERWITYFSIFEPQPKGLVKDLERIGTGKFP